MAAAKPLIVVKLPLAIAIRPGQSDRGFRLGDITAPISPRNMAVSKRPSLCVAVPMKVPHSDQTVRLRAGPMELRRN